MAQERLTPQQLAGLQSDPTRTRNICILAHVDHGKTTLSDCLIASNGVISARLAGQARYMDSTEEEQARGITMKSSAIALVHFHEPLPATKSSSSSSSSSSTAPQEAAPAAADTATAGTTTVAAEAPGGELGAAAAPASKVPFLINLIDSPGHVDFSMDVTTAARLCDGAVVVVDAVEGVCIQTHAVLKVAWAEGIRPTLVINKLDRLITELQLTPLEAYHHLCRIIEQANVIISELYTADLMAGLQQQQGAAAAAAAASAAAASASSAEEKELSLAEDGEGDFSHNGSGASSASGNKTTFAADTWAIDVDEKTEAQIFFDPAKGNVAFASAIDGWACNLDNFAALSYQKVGVSRALLRRALWGEYYLNPKTKKIVTGAAAAAANKGRPLCVPLFLEKLWAAYDALLINPDETRASKMISVLGLEGALTKRDIAAKDPKIKLQAVMRGWLPLADCVLGMVVRKVPSPAVSQRKRLEKLWPAAIPMPSLSSLSSSRPPLRPDMTLEERLARVRHAIENCDPSPDAECVVYVSKMFAVPQASLPDPNGAYRQQWGQQAAVAPYVPPFPGFPSSFPSSLLPTKDEAWYGLEGERPHDSLSLVPIGAASALRKTNASGENGSGDGGDAAGAEASSSSSSAATMESGGVETLVAFARVFSGVLRPDSPIFVLGPRYDPRDPSADKSAHISQLGATKQGESPMQLFLMMGREVAPIPLAYAGSIVGIGGLSSHVLKTATLSSTPACISLAAMAFQSTPLVKVAVEPLNPRDLAAVERGLALLNQADPCVEVTVADNGELQLSALGELHLDRCIKDITTRFARVEVQVSPPIQSFQETIISAPLPSSAPLPASMQVVGTAAGLSSPVPGGGASTTSSAATPASALFSSASATALYAGGPLVGSTAALQAAASAMANKILGEAASNAAAAAGVGGGGDDAGAALLVASPSNAGSGAGDADGVGNGAPASSPLSPASSASGAGPSGFGGGGAASLPPGFSQDSCPVQIVPVQAPPAGAVNYSFYPSTRSFPIPPASLSAGGLVAFHQPSGSVFAYTPDRQLLIRLRAFPLPVACTQFLQSHGALIKSISSAAEVALMQSKRAGSAGGSSNQHVPTAFTDFARKAKELFVTGCSAAPSSSSSSFSATDDTDVPDSASSEATSGLAPFLSSFAPAAAAAVVPSPVPGDGAVGASSSASSASALAATLFDNILAFGAKQSGPNILACRPEALDALSQSLGLGLAAGGRKRKLLSSLWANAGVFLGQTAGETGQTELGGGGKGEGEGAQDDTALPTSVHTLLSVLRSSILQGFQLATGAGPLCAEPLWGVCFVIEELRAINPSSVTVSEGGSGGSGGGSEAGVPAVAVSISSGQTIASMRDACRVAFQAGMPRLVEAMYSCQLTCSGGRGGGTSGEQLGKLYAVLSRRRGRVLSEDVWEGTQTFVISAFLPVAESFGFADDLRKKTSGAATSPQLLFSHWEVLSQDPFFVPTTEEEKELHGDTLYAGQGGKNVAREYVDAVRTRKGLPVQKKIVEKADKQRNLSRKK